MLSNRIPWDQLPRSSRIEIRDFEKGDATYFEWRMHFAVPADMPGDAWTDAHYEFLKLVTEKLQGLAKPACSGAGSWLEFTPEARYCLDQSYYFNPVDPNSENPLETRRRDFHNAARALKTLADEFCEKHGLASHFEPIVESNTRSIGNPHSKESGQALLALDEMLSVQKAAAEAPNKAAKPRI